MAKTMRVESGTDRINGLPDELLCHILSFLPTESAVCASLLSKRWRYLHTLISSIDLDLDDIKLLINRFDRRGNYPAKLSQLINYVERDLISKRSIQRFRLKRSRNGDCFPINEWIAALLCHNIQELELCIHEIPFEPCNLRASLFSSETLVVLKLVNRVATDASGCQSLKIPDEVCLPKLKVLHIRQTMVHDAQLNKLLSSCLVLDDLFLDKVFTLDSRGPCKLDISNATLRRLAIGPLSHAEAPAAEVVINCPALEYLSFYLVKDQPLVLLAKQSLAEVVISSCSWRLPMDYVYEHELDVFKEIKYIQSLKLLHDAIRGIYGCKVDLPLFENLTYLEICDSIFLRDPRYLEYVLAPCVALQTLVFELRLWGHYLVKERKDIKYTLEQSRLVGLLCHLKTIKIQPLETSFVDNVKINMLLEVLMDIIKFFLNHAKILEELTIRIKDLLYTQQSKMRAGLLTIPRVSKKCRVVFNDEKVTDDNKSQYIVIQKARA